MRTFLLTVNGLTIQWMPYKSRLVIPSPGKKKTQSAHKFVGWSNWNKAYNGIICIAPVDIGNRRNVLLHKDIISAAKISNLAGEYDQPDIFGTIDIFGLICRWKSQGFGKTPKELHVAVKVDLDLDLANHLT